MSITASYLVSGLTCENCVKHVTVEVEAIAGVQSVQVDLVSGGTSTVHVTSEAALSDDAVHAAVDEAGYELVAG